MLTTVEEIFRAPDDWREREAEVFGIFTYGLENNFIRDEDFPEKALWIEMDNPETTECVGFELAEGIRVRVVVEGYVSMGKCGHFGMSDGQMHHVARITSAEIYFAGKSDETPP